MERVHRPRADEKVLRRAFKNKNETFYRTTVASPVGPLTLIATDKALVAVDWRKTDVGVEQKNEILRAAERQLKEYFAGQRTSFDLPLDPRGTEFQKRVWLELRKIPYGKTISYGEQARRIGKPRSSRAVGAANGKNPLGIIVPCHRVIGANGSLTGFGGGIENKKQLLELEGAIISGLN